VGEETKPGSHFKDGLKVEVNKNKKDDRKLQSDAICAIVLLLLSLVEVASILFCVARFLVCGRKIESLD
jgi:hypothetical protein